MRNPMVFMVVLLVLAMVVAPLAYLMGVALAFILMPVLGLVAIALIALAVRRRRGPTSGTTTPKV